MFLFTVVIKGLTVVSMQKVEQDGSPLLTPDGEVEIVGDKTKTQKKKTPSQLAH